MLLSFPRLRTVSVLGGCLIALASFSVLHAQQQPADSPPPPPPPRNDGGGPPRPPRLDDTVRDLGLDGEAKQKLDMLVATLHTKEQAARDEFLQQAKTLLTPEQFAKLQAATNHAPPPHPPQEGDHQQGAGPAAVNEHTAAKGTVILHGGYETDGRDGGRPVVLIAAALGVPTDVFRHAFSGVHPAGPGSGGPTDSEARANKGALMKVLQPYGVTDARLNEVSNYYRYMRSQGEMWKNTPAVITAVIADGAVTGFTITSAGAGYSSPPTITVAGYPGVTATATLSFSTDLATNGSIKTVTLDRSAK